MAIMRTAYGLLYPPRASYGRSFLSPPLSVLKAPSKDTAWILPLPVWMRTHLYGLAQRAREPDYTSRIRDLHIDRLNGQYREHLCPR